MPMKIHLEIKYFIYYVINKTVEYCPDSLLFTPVSSGCRYLAGEARSCNLTCRKCLKILNEKNVNVCHFGRPWETPRMIKATVDFLHMVSLQHCNKRNVSEEKCKL